MQRKRSIDPNQFNQGGLGRYCQESSAQKLIPRNLVDSDSNWYAGTKRLKLLVSGPSHDIFAVDVYYHQSCYLCFTKTKKASIEDGTNFDKEIVIREFNTYIRVKIIKEKSAYLLNKLLEDSNYFSSEFSIEPVFTCTKSLRRHLEINFPEVICFFNYGKFIIVYSADTNPCQYAVSTLKGTGLRNRDLTSAFAKVIRSSVESDLENQDEEWPMPPN